MEFFAITLSEIFFFIHLHNTHNQALSFQFIYFSASLLNAWKHLMGFVVERNQTFFKTFFLFHISLMPLF